MAFVPNKTATGFNQGGFKFVNPHKEPIKQLKQKRPKSEKNRGRKYQKQEKTAQEEAEDQQKIDQLRNFYVQILVKGLKNNNPIIKYGGRETFIQDIEKLKNAKIQINATLERLHSANQVGISGPGSSSGLDTSLVSPAAGESFNFGKMHDHYGKQQLQIISPPKINSGVFSDKTIEYSDDLNNRKSAQEPIQQDAFQKNVQKQLGQALDASPMSPFRMDAEGDMSPNGTLVAGQSSPGGFDDASIVEDNSKNRPHIQVESQLSKREEGRFSPFQLEQLAVSQQAPLEDDSNHLKQILEKSVIEDHSSIGGGGDRPRISLINKLKQSPHPSQHSQRNMIQATLSLQQVLQKDTDVTQSAQVILDQTGDKKIENFEFEMPVVHAQVNLHRKRQRNNEEKMFASLKHSTSPKGDFGGPTLSQNKELDSLWTPPDISGMNKTQGNQLDVQEIIRLQRPMHNKGSRVHQLVQNGEMSHSRSPKKENNPHSITHTTIEHQNNGSQTNLSQRDAKNQKVPAVQISLSQRLLAVQNLATGISGGQAFGYVTPNGLSGGFTFLPIQHQNQFRHPMSPQVRNASPQNLNSEEDNGPASLQAPPVVNVGSLSHFRPTKEPSLQGQFPQRSFGLNEQRFFKKGFVKEPVPALAPEDHIVLKEEKKRAQTASALQRGGKARNRTATHRMRNTQKLGSFNSTGMSWKDTIKEENNESKLGSTGPDGTVVLQATLVVGGKTLSNFFSQGDKRPISPQQLMEQGPGSSRGEKRIQLSSDLKIRRAGEQHASNIHTGMGNINQDNSDASFIKCSQISPKKEGDMTTTAIARDLNSEMNHNFTANLQRRYEGSSFVNLQGAVASFDERSPQKSKGDSLLRERSNSGSLTKRRTQNLQQYDIQNRKNVLAKTKNRIIDIQPSSVENRSPIPPDDDSSGPPNFLVRGTSTPNINNVTSKMEGAKVSSAINHSPFISAQEDDFTPVIQLYNGNSQEDKSQFHKISLNRPTTGKSISKQHPLATQKGEVQNIRLSFSGQTNRVENINDQAISQGAGTRASNNNKAQRMSDGTFSAGSMGRVLSGTQKPAAPNMNQTSFSFNRSDKQSAVRVDLKSRREPDNKAQIGPRRNKIEFKILQMNLQQAPTAERSNMMTCELDLSQHIPQRFKRYNPEKPNKVDFSALISQTLTLASPNLGSSFVSGSKNTVLQSKQWQEINQVKLSIQQQDVVIPRAAPDSNVQRLQLLSLQKNQSLTSSISTNAANLTAVQNSGRHYRTAGQQLGTPAASNRSNGTANLRQVHSRGVGVGGALGQLLSQVDESTPIRGPSLPVIRPQTDKNFRYPPEIRGDYLTQQSETLKNNLVSTNIGFYHKKESSKKTFFGQPNQDLSKELSETMSPSNMREASRAQSGGIHDRRNLSLPQQVNQEPFYSSVQLPYALLSSSQSKRSSVLFKHQALRLSQHIAA